jgi:hypothetical protein
MAQKQKVVADAMIEAMSLTLLLPYRATLACERETHDRDGAY